MRCPLLAIAALLVLGASIAGAEPLRKPCHGRVLCQTECTAGIGASCGALAKMTPDRAAELERRGCTLGDHDSCETLYSGDRYRQWDAEVRRTAAQATAAARRQCEKGDALLCRSLATLLMWAAAAGEGPRGPVHGAIEHARDLFRRGCDAGDLRACDELASALSGATDMNDVIVTSEEARAAWPLYEKACAGGYGPACESLEWKVKDRHPELSDDEVSERRWKLMNEACDKGDGRACERAGDLAEYHGAPALPRYEKGCALDDAASCGKVAWAYGDARDGEKLDPKRALPYAEKSCDADYQSGCVMLARLVRASDPARAHRLLEKACRREPFYDCPK